MNESVVMSINFLYLFVCSHFFFSLLLIFYSSILFASMLHLTNLNLPYAYIIYLTYVISYITCHKFCYYTMLLTWDLFSWRPALNYWGPSVSISLNLVGIGTDVSFYLRKRCAGSWIEREFGKIRTRLDKIERHLDIRNTRDSFTNDSLNFDTTRH